MEEANLLDYLLLARDRPDNWEFSCDGHLILVDNTQTFSALGKYSRANQLTAHRWRKSLIDRLQSLTLEDLRELLGDLLGPQEIVELEFRRQTCVKYVAGILQDLTTAEVFYE